MGLVFHSADGHRGVSLAYAAVVLEVVGSDDGLGLIAQRNDDGGMRIEAHADGVAVFESIE